MLWFCATQLWVGTFYNPLFKCNFKVLNIMVRFNKGKIWGYKYMHLDHKKANDNLIYNNFRYAFNKLYIRLGNTFWLNEFVKNFDTNKTILFKLFEWG